MLTWMKKKSISAAFGRVFIALIVCAIIILLIKVNPLDLVLNPTDINGVSTENLGQYSGQMVQMEIRDVLDIYAQTTQDSSEVISRELVILTPDEQHLMGVVFLERDYKRYKDSLFALNRYTGPPQNAPTFSVVGTLKPMDSESVQFFDETLKESGYSLDLAAHYYLKVNSTPSGNDTWVVLVMSLICIGAVMWALWSLIYSISGLGQRRIKKFCSQAEDPAYCMDVLENEFSQCLDLKQAALTPNYILYNRGVRSYILPVADVVWAYQKTTRTNGVATGFALMLGTVGKKSATEIPLTKKTIDPALDYVFYSYPGVAMGYNADLQSLYRTAPLNLRQIAAQQRQPATPPPPVSSPQE